MWELCTIHFSHGRQRAFASPLSPLPPKKRESAVRILQFTNLVNCVSSLWSLMGNIDSKKLDYISTVLDQNGISQDQVCYIVEIYVPFWLGTVDITSHISLYTPSCCDCNTNSLANWLFPVPGQGETSCCVCKGETSEAPNRIVLCDNCELGGWFV